jgi:hypothetical protein
LFITFFFVLLLLLILLFAHHYSLFWQSFAMDPENTQERKKWIPSQTEQEAIEAFVLEGMLCNIPKWIPIPFEEEKLYPRPGHISRKGRVLRLVSCIPGVSPLRLL